MHAYMSRLYEQPVLLYYHGFYFSGCETGNEIIYLISDHIAKSENHTSTVTRVVGLEKCKNTFNYM